MRAQVFDQAVLCVKNVCRQSEKIIKEPIQKNMRLRDDLGFDSIDLVVLQVELEDYFHIRFDPLEDDFIKIFNSVGTLCECLEVKIGKNDDKW